VQPSGLGHGRQRRALPADVAEHLEHHEAEEEEVEAGTDPRHDDEGHLQRRRVKEAKWREFGGHAVHRLATSCFPRPQVVVV